MIAGYYYTFVYSATNMIGVSVLSTQLTVAIADYPVQPTAVTMVSYSNTSIVVLWQRVSNQ